MTTTAIHTPIALTIAGSDSGGGAGIQADLKTFSALGAYGCSVITALTAQNTRGVQGIFDIPPHFIQQQLDSVFSDLAVTAVKVGMLSQPEVIQTVLNELEIWQQTTLVVDPVMVATSGDVLLQEAAIAKLREALIPKATLITPNLPEAAVLLGVEIPQTLEAMRAMVKPLKVLGCNAVLLKGGHLKTDDDQAVDIFFDGETYREFTSAWVNTRNTHGTGCTLSSAITALLAQGEPLISAVEKAKQYIAGALAAADQLEIGSGHGPVHHSFGQW